VLDTAYLLVTSSSTNLQTLAHRPSSKRNVTYINPNWSLRDQTRFGAVLKLRGDQSQHILTTSKKLEPGSVVDVGLSFVEAFLIIWSDRFQVLSLLQTHQSILLASSSVSSMRLQETPIDELEVRFERARRLIFALRSERQSKHHRKKHTNEAQRNRKLVKRVTWNKT